MHFFTAWVFQFRYHFFLLMQALKASHSPVLRLFFTCLLSGMMDSETFLAIATGIQYLLYCILLYKFEK